MLEYEYNVRTDATNHRSKKKNYQQTLRYSYLHNCVNTKFLPPLNHISPHVLRFFYVKLSCFQKPAKYTLVSRHANIIKTLGAEKKIKIPDCYESENEQIRKNNIICFLINVVKENFA